MCGIVGYIGKNEPTSFLISALERLEYRGYDSSGVAVCRCNKSKHKNEYKKTIEL